MTLANAKRILARMPDLYAQEDRLNPWLQEIRHELYSTPIQKGYADILFQIGTVFGSGLKLNHDYETFSLMAYAYRKSLNDKDLEFDILTNLSHACLFQKSFEESYQYGKLAEEKFRRTDVDHLANMIVACTITNRIPEAEKKAEKLKSIDELRIAEVNETLSGGGALKPTKNEDSSDALADLNNAIKLWGNRRYNEAIDNIREAVVKLAEFPDGINSWKCWKLLGEFYVSQSNNQQTEIETIEYYARAAAAFGKMVAFHPNVSQIDPKLLLWHGQALGQLRLFNFAIKSLEKALSIQTNDRRLSMAIEDSLEYCRHMERR